ncbi:hypothetical protein MKY85_07675 [Paenibacillus sp. FSL R5-0749]|uniref:hypothetical protein n=1 Tax=Paenibacillus sp. FSL R5-0749 TaxID=2921657 RepID=UPI00315A134F
MQHQLMNTELGVISGRDAIFLDKLNFTSTSEAELIREINARLCSQVNHENYIPYKFIVKGIYYFNMVDLDISYSNILRDVNVHSSLIEVVDSNLLATIKEVRGLDLRHIIICTYDEIFEIACKELEMKFYNND